VSEQFCKRVIEKKKADDGSIRELAFQIHEQFVALGQSINLKSTVVVGGLDQMKQAVELASRPHVVVATPGRLCDLIRSSSQGQWNLSKVKYLVLDEADRLLHPGFAEELGFILSQLPAQKQTLLFTATITDAIMHLREKEPANGKEKPFLHLTDTE
jgi:ATP-dependent RNA helicase DDX49/DBP8